MHNFSPRPVSVSGGILYVWFDGNISVSVSFSALQQTSREELGTDLLNQFNLDSLGPDWMWLQIQFDLIQYSFCWRCFSCTRLAWIYTSAAMLCLLPVHFNGITLMHFLFNIETLTSISDTVGSSVMHNANASCALTTVRISWYPQLLLPFLVHLVYSFVFLAHHYLKADSLVMPWAILKGKLHIKH